MPKTEGLEELNNSGTNFQEERFQKCDQVIQSIENSAQRQAEKNRRLFIKVASIVAISAGFITSEMKDKWGKHADGIEALSTGVKETDELIEKIASLIGSDAVKRIMSIPSIENEQERQEALRAEPSATFENLDGFIQGMTTEDIKLAVKACLPKGFSVEKVKYVDKFVTVGDDYNLNRNGEPAIEVAHVSHYGKEIVFTRGAKSIGVDVFLEALCHEAGHCGDFMRNKYLNLDDRLWLQERLLERIQSDNRFHSNYVESINNRNKRAELEYKSIEYFGEIMARYIKDKASLPWEDKILIQTLIDRIDPTFDVEKARQTLIQIAKTVESRNHTYTYTEDYEYPKTKRASDQKVLTQKDKHKKNGKK